MILEGFKFSISFLKGNFGKLFTILSLPLILDLALSLTLSFYEIDQDAVVSFLVVTLGAFIQTWAQCIVILLIVDTGSKRTTSDLYIYSLYKLPMIILWSLVVGIAITLGFLLLILPGIYIALRYSFYIFEILLSTKKSSDAIKETFAMTEKKALEIFIYFLPLITLIIFLSVVIFSFTNLLLVQVLYTYLLITFSSAYSFYLYNKIKTDVDEA